MIDERSQASIWVDNRVDLTSFKKIGVEEPLSIWDWRQNLSKDHGKINLLRLFTIDNWKNDGFNLTIQETRIIIKFWTIRSAIWDHLNVTAQNLPLGTVRNWPIEGLNAYLSRYIFLYLCHNRLKQYDMLFKTYFLHFGNFSVLVQ